VSLTDRIDGALLRAAADAADKVRDALAAALDSDAIATAFLNTHPDKPTPEQAREWAKHNVRFNRTKLETVFRDIYGIAWALGVDSSKSQMAHAFYGKASGPNLRGYVGFDWSKWKPGNHPAEFLLRPPGGLQRLLNRRGTIINSIEQTSYDRVGTILADAMRSGAAPSSVAKEFIMANIGRLAESPARAMTIATTEMARGMMVATMDTYNDYGVGQVEWIGIDPCESCAENEDAGPIALGDAFPSGDTEPPAHPNCRCTISPVIEDYTPTDGSLTNDFGIEVSVDSSHEITDFLSGKEAMSEQVKSVVPGPAEVERAISRLAILPNPAHPDLSEGDAGKYVESPWATTDVPTVDPNVYDSAVQLIVNLADLTGTDPFLKRKRVIKHIEAMGQALTKFRSLPIVADDNGRMIILDGHHRLMASWLLGDETAPVWKVEL
jgi:hypothetical protein